MDKLLWVVIGVVAGWAGQNYLPVWWRLLRGVPDLDVHVEADPANLYAGQPPWHTAAYIFRSGPPPSPPSNYCPDWWQWAHTQGAIDSRRTELKVTLVGGVDATVVLSGVKPRVHSLQDLSGVVGLCGAGGAEAIPRHVQIRLDHFDPPTALFVDEQGNYIKNPTFVIRKGDAEELHIVAYAEQASVDWTVSLVLIVNGKSKEIELSDNGLPFRTSGAEGLPQYIWNADRWEDQGLAQL